jgi:hypothetical protein
MILRDGNYLILRDGRYFKLPDGSYLQLKLIKLPNKTEYLHQVKEHIVGK